MTSSTRRINAVVSTCDGKPDLEDEVIEQNAFPNAADIIISRWAHDAVKDTARLPVGKATLYHRGIEIVAVGEFFTTPAADATRTAVRAMREFIELSIAFRIIRARAPNSLERERGIKRVLQKIDPWEMTFCVRGVAGKGRTRVLLID